MHVRSKQAQPCDLSSDLESISPEQVVGHSRPSDPQISPDGSRILYVLRPISKTGEHDESAVWIVDFTDGEPRQFTSGTGADQDPRWSPDGRWIVFLSDRAERGKSALYRMPADGGEGVLLWSHEGDIDSPAWSPDGAMVAVLMSEPETADDKRRETERDDARAWDKDHKYQRLWVIDVESGKARCVSPPRRHVVHFAWAPASDRIALNTIPAPRIDEIFRETDLLIIGRHGGEPKHVCRPRGDTDGLCWSDDATRLAWAGPIGQVINNDTVLTVTVDGGEPTPLDSPQCFGTVDHLAPVDGGARLLVQSQEGLSNALTLLRWDGSVDCRFEPPDGGSFPKPVSVTPDGRRCAVIFESGTQAPDVWVLDLAVDSPKMARRTHLNPELEQARKGVPEVVSWTAEDGFEIQGLLFKPAVFRPGSPVPMIVQVHGGPTARWADEFTATWHDWAHSLAGRGIAVLLPNPRGSTGRGPCFTNALVNQVGHGEFCDIMAGVDAMVNRGVADGERLGIGGWSWGGYMTAWAITQTSRFRAAIVGAGLPNMVSDNGVGDIPSANLSYFERSLYEDPEPFWERSPIRYVRNVTTPTLILHGEEDRRVSMSQGLELYTALRMLDVEVEFVTYPREGHGILERNHQRDLITRVVDWFERRLLEGAQLPAKSNDKS